MLILQFSPFYHLKMVRYSTEIIPIPSELNAFEGEMINILNDIFPHGIDDLVS